MLAGTLTLGQVTSFAALALLLTLLPGADTALVIRAALAKGRRGAIAATFGVCSGLLVWGALTAAGLAAFLTRFPTTYRALTILGGGYLVFLGWQSWQASRTLDHGSRSVVGTSPYLSGLLTNLLNPKVAIFYFSVLPHFAPPGAFLFLRSLLLAMIHALLGMAWFTFVGVVIERSFLSPRAQKWRSRLQAFTALLLLALGLSILIRG